MATAFDTLTISRSIRDAGVDERAAEAITHAIAEAISRDRGELATNARLDLVEQRLGARLDNVEVKIELVEQRLIAKIADSNLKLFLAMGGLTIGVAGLIVAAIKLL